MKRAFILALLLAATGGFLGLLMLKDPGYALLAYHETSVEMSLWVAAALWLVSVFLAVVVTDLLFKLFNLQQWFASWSGARRQRKSLRLFSLGMQQLETGEWSKAERNLFNAARYSAEPLPAYLAAARAAQKLLAFDRSEKYLVLAEEKHNRLAVGLARARLLSDAGRWEQAAIQLRLLREQFPNEAEPIKRLVQALEKLNQWGELADLLPSLRKRVSRNDAEAWSLERQANEEVMEFIASSGTRVNQEYTRKRLMDYFEALPRKLRDDDELLGSYAACLIEITAHDDAEKALRERLQKRWQSRLIELYGRCLSTDPTRALEFAERFLAAHPHDAQLMLTLARLNLQNRQWNRAREFYESAIGLKKSPEAYAELVRLLIRQNDHQAHRYLVEGLQLMAGKTPDLPLP